MLHNKILRSGILFFAAIHISIVLNGQTAIQPVAPLFPRLLRLRLSRSMEILKLIIQREFLISLFRCLRLTIGVINYR